MPTSYTADGCDPYAYHHANEPVPFHLVFNRTNRLTDAGVGMAYLQSGDAYWVMWIGERQWEGSPGEFDLGQPGWLFPSDEAADRFIFSPAFGPKTA